jgi:hypothetical protein
VAGFIAGTVSFEMLIGRARLRPDALAGPIQAFAVGLAAQYVNGDGSVLGEAGAGSSG